MRENDDALDHHYHHRFSELDRTAITRASTIDEGTSTLLQLEAPEPLQELDRPDAQLAAIRGQGLQVTPEITVTGTQPLGPQKEPSESAWTVSDRGEELYKEFNPPGTVDTGNSTPTSGRLKILHEKLFGVKYHTEVQGKRKKSIDPTMYFFPRGVLEEIITTEVVVESIQESIDSNRLKKLSSTDVREYAEKICFTPRANEDTPSYRKMFSILVLSEHPESIVEFVDDGLSDKDLPLISVPVEMGSNIFDLRRSRAPGRRLTCFKDWTLNSRDTFDRWQWPMVAPYFAQSPHRRVRLYKLSDRDVLPWTMKYDQRRFGGYSEVIRVKIHGRHHDYHGSTYSDGSFALKILRYEFSSSNDSMASDTSINGGKIAPEMIAQMVKNEFEEEVEILKKFSGDMHPHLVSVLAAFQKGEQYCLLFHWAESDLLRLWKNSDPGPALDKANIEWMIGQFRGIVDGLQHIHNYQMTNPTTREGGGADSATTPIYGRHGDIKPENLLLYKKQGDPNDKGIIKITDFGLTRFHSEKSRSNIRPSRITGFSPTYRPPECDFKGSTISRAFDIWSLGCVLLEFVTWYLGGWGYLEKYVKARMHRDINGHNSDQFFEIVTSKDTKKLAARVKPEVREWIQALHAHSNCSETIHELLNFIIMDMLVVLPNDADATVHNRASCEQVYRKIDSLYEKLKTAHKVLACPWSTGGPATTLEAFEVILNDEAERKAKLRLSELREHDGPTVRLSNASRLGTSLSTRWTMS